jgi:hypothetical protein
VARYWRTSPVFNRLLFFANKITSKAIPNISTRPMLPGSDRDIDCAILGLSLYTPL